MICSKMKIDRAVDWRLTFFPKLEMVQYKYFVLITHQCLGSEGSGLRVLIRVESSVALVDQPMVDSLSGSDTRSS